MTGHIDFEQLCDFADGELAGDGSARVERHLQDCSACAAQLASLSLLAARVGALPRAHAVPPELWRGIRAALPPRDIAHEKSQRARNGRLLAAAAIIAVASSGLTVLVLRGTRPQQRTSAPATASITPRVALPAQSAADERGYARSADALQETLAQRRDSLAPSTIATVERSLRVADSAIAEARMALARDPANRVLARLFASNYERKIDLLRRANELAPRT